MEPGKELLLQALRAALQKKTVDWEEELSQEQWGELFALAAAHRVLPMVFEAVISGAAAKKADPQIFQAVKQQVRQQVILQTVRTDALLKLLPRLRAAGATPLVVKGIICRQLYPNPDCRASGDEDLLIPEEQFPICHETMLAAGLVLSDAGQDLNGFEIPYDQKGSRLHIELHKQLFAPGSDAYGELNHYFAGVHQRHITQTIQGVPVDTMDHTDHLFYLICHSFKHFLHSGFGIRQVCDICLYANRFGSQVDWTLIRKHCEEIRADLFAAALFRIGEKYLTFRPDDACYPPEWRNLIVDETAMLEDLLEAGVFGSSSMSRLHSSSMTLHEVSARKQGKKSGGSVLKTLFPSAGALSGRYPWLKQKPWLLPLAWTDRIIHYGRETASGESGNNAAESLKIGSRRIELLKQYGVIDR